MAPSIACYNTTCACLAYLSEAIIPYLCQGIAGNLLLSRLVICQVSYLETLTMHDVWVAGLPFLRVFGLFCVHLGWPIPKSPAEKAFNVWEGVSADGPLQRPRQEHGSDGASTHAQTPTVWRFWK